MSKSRTVQQALNRAYSELSTVRHLTKDSSLTRIEYNRVKECYGVLGKIRVDYLDKLEQENAA